MRNYTISLENIWVEMHRRRQEISRVRRQVDRPPCPIPPTTLASTISGGFASPPRPCWSNDDWQTWLNQNEEYERQRRFERERREHELRAWYEQQLRNSDEVGTIVTATSVAKETIGGRLPVITTTVDGSELATSRM
jgi:hypothetical protein